MSPIYYNFLVDFLLPAHIQLLLISGRCWSPLKYERVGIVLIYADVQISSSFCMLSPIVSAIWSFFNVVGTQQPGQMSLQISNPLRPQLFGPNNSCLHVYYRPIAEK